MISDYKCKECGKVLEYNKSYEEKVFPDAIGCDCGGIATRVYKTNFVVKEEHKAVRS